MRLTSDSGLRSSIATTRGAACVFPNDALAITSANGRRRRQTAAAQTARKPIRVDVMTWRCASVFASKKNRA